MCLEFGSPCKKDDDNKHETTTTPTPTPTSLVELYPGDVGQITAGDDVDFPVSAVLLVHILNEVTLNQAVGPGGWLPLETNLTFRHHLCLQVFRPGWN